MDNCVGKIVRIQYTNQVGERMEKKGIVLRQNTPDNWISISMLLTNGSEWSLSAPADRIIKVSSTRIEQDLRCALTGYYKAWTKREEFLNNFQKERILHDQEVADAVAAVAKCFGVLEF